MRYLFGLLVLFGVGVFLGGCGKGSLKYETVFDNLDSGKNTELHVREYWKSIEGQVLKTSGEVLEVRGGRNGAEIQVVNRNRPTVRGANLTLLVPDLGHAAKLKVGEKIHFKGTLRNYRGGRNNSVVLTLDEGVIDD